VANQRSKKTTGKAANSLGKSKSISQLYQELLGLREVVRKAERNTSERSGVTQRPAKVNCDVQGF
jgi:hypothetical protein